MRPSLCFKVKVILRGPGQAALFLAAAVSMLVAFPALTAAQTIEIERMFDGLEEPWAIAFLPEGGLLVTEREGRLLHIDARGDTVPVADTPIVAARGQGGLLDVMVPRDFAQSRRVWLSYAAATGDGAGTSVGFGRLSADGARLEEFRVVMPPAARPGGRHFGARLVEAADGAIFLTTGDRGEGGLAQRLDGPEGKVLRFTAEGAPLTAAEFAGRGDVWPGLYSYGHRNIQGAALDAEGRLLTVEHGARGGDEVNAPAPGRNYGWPVITYGRDYDGSKIGEGTSKPGMEQPLHYWDPSIAPSGLMVYSGALWPEWRGHVFTGSLNSDLISRLDPAQGFAEARIQTAETGRVRDITEGPDGAIWFLSVTEGAVFRMTPG